MRRLCRRLLMCVAVIAVMLAILITALRVLLPHVNTYRTQVLRYVTSITNLPFDVARISGSLSDFGLAFELHHVSLDLPELRWQGERVTVELDMWQSLLQQRWQFKQLAFFNTQLVVNQSLSSHFSSSSSFSFSQQHDLLLHRFERLVVRESRISLPTVFDERVDVEMPDFIWLNSAQQHQAQGQIRFRQHDTDLGAIRLQMALQNKQGALDGGKVYVQLEEVELTPLLNIILPNATALTRAKMNIDAWLTLDKGQFSQVDVQMKKGDVRWLDEPQEHHFSVQDFNVRAVQQSENWRIDVPSLPFTTNGANWSNGQFSLLYLAKTAINENAQLRLRANNIQLKNVAAFISLSPLSFSSLLPHSMEAKDAQWQPQGTLETVSLDIPLSQDHSTFLLKWKDVAWQSLPNLPGITHFSGTASGTLQNGSAKINIQQGEFAYHSMFPVPLEIEQADSEIAWQYSEQNGIKLWSDLTDIKARALWVKGRFNFEYPTSGEPFLGILAGAHAYDASEAWRYFPVSLMKEKLVAYLTRAIRGGEVHNASLIYAGNPKLFPFRQNNGLFQVWAPVEHATFEFSPEWPTLNDFNVDLKFENDGLWMTAAKIKLGKAQGSAIHAYIPHYDEQRLLIDAALQSDAGAVQDYFQKTPLQTTVGHALSELVLDGQVKGKLHLNIPLQGGNVDASGQVALAGNSLFIKSINHHFDDLYGSFSFKNNELIGDALSANWQGEPIAVDFSTVPDEQAYHINVGVNGRSSIKKIPQLPSEIMENLSGSFNWQSQIKVTLPHNAEMMYQAKINADLAQLDSQLPVPLKKVQGESLPVELNVEGNREEFIISGLLNKRASFISRWQKSHDAALKLVSAYWQNDNQEIPALPEESKLQAHLPELDGTAWLAVLTNKKVKDSLHGLTLPAEIALHIDQLQIAGQQWNALALTKKNASSDWYLLAKGDEIDAQLQMRTSDNVGILTINRLNYHPSVGIKLLKGEFDTVQKLSDSERIFTRWPRLQIHCTACWFMNRPLGRIEAELQPRGERLVLENGLIDSGYAQLSLQGEWYQANGQHASLLSGKLSGNNISLLGDKLGIHTPLKNSPFGIHFSLAWQGTPWQPKVNSLNGVLQATLQKGELENMGGGAAERFLRVVSFDGLRRKLLFDFSDTLGHSFYFDGINASARIEEGVLFTQDLYVDGLSADIALSGVVDLTKRQLNLEVDIAPELSVTAGVMTTFVVNPVAGVVVVAASKLLAPLWRKMPLMRYQITGSFEHPQFIKRLKPPKEIETP